MIPSQSSWPPDSHHSRDGYSKSSDSFVMAAHCNGGPSHYHAPMPHPQHFAESPESVGVDPAKLAALFDRAEREVRDGTLPSAQLAVARDGKIAAMRSFGTRHARRATGARHQRHALRDVLVHQGDHVGRRVAAAPGGQAAARRAGRRGDPRVRRERQGSRHARTAAHAHAPASRARPSICASSAGPISRRASRRGGSTGSRAAASSTTRRAACG